LTSSIRVPGVGLNRLCGEIKGVLKPVPVNLSEGPIPLFHAPSRRTSNYKVLKIQN
jgi:hypothetical protein